MIGRVSRLGGIGLAVCGILTLPGGGQRRAPAVAQAAGPPVPPRLAAPLAFTLDTPVERIAADGRGKAVLDRDLPGLMSSSQYILFDDMSLSQIATLSSGQLTKTKLDLVEADLSHISR
jgi:hypothetical protein